MTGLSDSFQRPINYLRISVTDRCNLRCLYCMPEEGVRLLPREDILTYEELRAIVQAAAELGVSRVRLTGGEPLVRGDIVDLVAMLSSVAGIEDISLTTNGLLLAHNARRLKEAGLHRINVSLDTLRPERFQRITRWGKLEQVMAGIQAAREAGLHPVKVNMVVLRGVNDDELLDMARLTLSGEWHVRFIELMPFGSLQDAATCGEARTALQFVPVSEIRRKLEQLGTLEPVKDRLGAGPARYYRWPGAPGTVGFISPISECFCSECNRLRLTADGKLRPCLLQDKETDLRQCIRQGATNGHLQEVIRQVVTLKPESHLLDQGRSPLARLMSQIGG
ncbi:MAG: GTP 3',8-cyclase MoaA [Chloroflexi bacterium]|nr:GTP 3',8-cyclase MoaA [Chloroflexota bacterium]